MNGPAEELVLQAGSRWKWFLVFLLFAAASAFGYWLITDGPLNHRIKGWLVVIMCPIIALAALIVTVLGLPALRINAEGFCWTRRQGDVIRWDEVTEFTTHTVHAKGIPFLTHVVFDLTESSPTRKKMPGFVLRRDQPSNDPRGGHDFHLPSTYGMDVAELASLLNQRLPPKPGRPESP